MRTEGATCGSPLRPPPLSVDRSALARWWFVPPLALAAALVRVPVGRLAALLALDKDFCGWHDWGAGTVVVKV